MNGVRGTVEARARTASRTSAGASASNTLPIEVSTAGNRVPMLIPTDMIRRVGTLAT